MFGIVEFDWQDGFRPKFFYTTKLELEDCERIGLTLSSKVDKGKDVFPKKTSTIIHSAIEKCFW